MEDIVKITSLGHSAFQLEESTGTKIVTDPYNDSVGQPMPKTTADAVTISHDHYDHNNLESIEGSPIVINFEGAFEVSGVHISSVYANHDNHGGVRRGKTLVFKYRLDGVEVCHMGDIGEDCNAFLSEFIMPVNILLIPVGGKYTVDAERAKEYVDRLMPDVVIPMHYRTKNIDLGLDKVDDFIELFDDEDVVYVEGNEVTFNRVDFDGERTKVYVFEN